MKSREKRLIFLLLLALAGLTLAVGPECPVRALTGIPCPGCGMTRAWRSVLALDLAGAFRQHPMFWGPPVVLWLFWREFRPFRHRWANIALTGALTAGALACYGVRMYFGLIE